MFRIFEDRGDAGRALVQEVRNCNLEDPLILGLPRGGVPVAYEIARALGAELDTLIVRKLGAPFQPELAIGAIASGGIRVINDDVMALASGLSRDVLEKIVAREQLELERRETAYRGDRPHPSLQGRNVVLVDDGMATGATMRAAVESVRSQSPASITVAVPTASRDAIRIIKPMADQVVCLEAPASFFAVGEWYRNFSQTTDSEVRLLLDKQAATQAALA